MPPIKTRNMAATKISSIGNFIGFLAAGSAADQYRTNISYLKGELNPSATRRTQAKTTGWESSALRRQCKRSRRNGSPPSHWPGVRPPVHRLAPAAPSPGPVVSFRSMASISATLKFLAFRRPCQEAILPVLHAKKGVRQKQPDPLILFTEAPAGIRTPGRPPRRALSNFQRIATTIFLEKPLGEINGWSSSRTLFPCAPQSPFDQPATRACRPRSWPFSACSCLCIRRRFPPAFRALPKALWTGTSLQ